MSADTRIGQGWDLHRLVRGRPLLIGGVLIPHHLGEDGHSDGDVLCHAITDAILGAANLGDIGLLFPPSDDAWRGADSTKLLRAALELARAQAWEIVNLDCTVILEEPRLGPWRPAIRESLGACLGIDGGLVSVKAKTNEGLGALGAGDAVAAMAVCLLRRKAGRLEEA